MGKANKIRNEYYFLRDMLEQTDWALKGDCDDIDCDHYLYKSCLKKKYKPVLAHSYSCMNHLKLRKEALMGILSLSRYKHTRYTKCSVCGKKLDELGNDFRVIVFNRPYKDRKLFECTTVTVHKTCAKKVKIPTGWQRF